MDDGGESGRGGGGGGGKSWTELKATLCELRRQLSSISTVVPTSVSFRPLPDGSTRLFFLGTLANGWETTLHYADIPGEETRTLGKLHWQQLVELNLQSGGGGGGGGGGPGGGGGGGGRATSREEQLLLERKRLTTWGITSYELEPISGKIVFPAAGTLYQAIDTTIRNGPLFPSELRTGTLRSGTHGAKLNPLICPSNPDLVAYVSNCDIWVAHEPSGTAEQLTFSHRGGRNLADDPLSSGNPSYVIQEEFNRYQGLWWQPQSKDGLYRILYEEVDDSEVNIYTFPSSTFLPEGGVEQYRFPRAGSPNSKSNFKLLELSLREGNESIASHRILELGQPLSQLFPWVEYIVRAGWTPDSNHVWLELVDRRQKRLELVLIPLECWLEPPPNVYSSSSSRLLTGDLTSSPAAALLSSSGAGSSTSPLVHVIGGQTSDVWINVSDLLYFLPESEPDKVSWIWSSEETGYRHLYHHTACLRKKPGTTPRGLQCLHNGVDTPSELLQMHYPRGTVRALTTESWTVLDEGLWVDTQRGLVYFTGLRESVLEKHLYVVSYHSFSQVRLLTQTGFSYKVEINQDCSLCVATYSNIKTPPACLVFRIAHTDSTVNGISLIPIGHLVEPQVSEKPLPTPELFSHTISSGDTLHGMILRPYAVTPGVKYPTVLNVYGGPEVQVVTNTFKDMRYWRLHMLASQGYCVVAIDSRGSYHRGLAFEAHIKHRMGTVELADQVEMLLWLSSQESIGGLIDLSRVAIFGWSYGGYLSLMGLAQHPDLFKVAVAGAPVTSWTLYDTGYTERYMDLPSNNPAGYKAGSVLTYVHQFPEEENRLLIVHGLLDENVHFIHTSSLISQLIRRGKPYQLQVYPTERHSLRSLEASKHYETMLLSFLQRNL